jgi:hypothetical protein
MHVRRWNLDIIELVVKGNEVNVSLFVHESMMKKQDMYQHCTDAI